MNNQVQDKVLREQMTLVIKALKEKFHPYGVTLLVYDYGDKGLMNYMSTSNRHDMLAAMKEFISKHEGSYFESGTETKQ